MVGDGNQTKTWVQASQDGASQRVPFYFEVLEFKDAESALLKGAHTLYLPHKLFLPHPSCQVSVGHVLLKSVSNGARIIHL